MPMQRNEWVNEWTNEQMNEWTNERTSHARPIEWERNETTRIGSNDNEFDRNKTNCIESEREQSAHGDNECNWRLQLPCACTLPSFTNECSYICVYTHGDWLNWTLVGRRSVNAMQCDAMWWADFGLAIYLTQLNWLCMHIVWWLLNDLNVGGLIVLAHSVGKFSSH